MSKLETGLHYPLKLDSLPPNWQIGYVGDFVDAIQPGFASGKHNKEGTGIPHIRPFNVDRQGKLDLSEIKSVAPDSDAKRLHTGDVLFNNTNSPELIGKTAIIASAGDWGFSNHMTRIRFKDDIAPKFAAYQLHFLWMMGYYLHNCVKHVNQASISSKTLANAVPFIAPPLDQQKRIVAEIEKQFSRLDEAVANLKHVKANLKRYKAAVLKAAASGRLVETEAERAHREGRSFETGAQLLQRILETRRSQWQGKGKYKEPAAPDSTVLSELPEGWVWAALDQLSWDSGYGTSAKCSYENDGPAVLRIPNVDKAAIDLTDIKCAPSDFLIAEGEALSPGDMLVIRTNGSKSLIGRAAIVAMRFQQPTTYASYLIRFRLLDGERLSAWVLAYWQSHPSRLWIESRAATSAGQHNISMSVLAMAPVPLPPVEEQHRIVAEVDRRLSLLRETEALVDANLQRAERLRQSILAQAFSGRLKLWEKSVGELV